MKTLILILLTNSLFAQVIPYDTVITYERVKVVYLDNGVIKTDSASRTNIYKTPIDDYAVIGRWRYYVNGKRVNIIYVK